MGKKGHSEEEILRILREAESGNTAVEICRQHGTSRQTFYLGCKPACPIISSHFQQVETMSPVRRP